MKRKQTKISKSRYPGGLPFDPYTVHGILNGMRGQESDYVTDAIPSFGIYPTSGLAILVGRGVVILTDYSEDDQVGKSIDTISELFGNANRPAISSYKTWVHIPHNKKRRPVVISNVSGPTDYAPLELVVQINDPNTIGKNFGFQEAKRAELLQALGGWAANYTHKIEEIVDRTSAIAYMPRLQEGPTQSYLNIRDFLRDRRLIR